MIIQRLQRFSIPTSFGVCRFFLFITHAFLFFVCSFSFSFSFLFFFFQGFAALPHVAHSPLPSSVAMRRQQDSVGLPRRRAHQAHDGTEIHSAWRKERKFLETLFVGEKRLKCRARYTRPVEEKVRPLPGICVITVKKRDFPIRDRWNELGFAVLWRRCRVTEIFRPETG